MPQATYDLADARRCLKQLREDLAAELPARAVSGEPGEGGEGIVTVRVPPSKVVVIEGRFALHPDIADAVDLRVHCGGSVHPLLLRPPECLVPPWPLRLEPLWPSLWGWAAATAFAPPLLGRFQPSK